jgi:hypothetical protein
MRTWLLTPAAPAALPMIEVDGVQNLHTLHGYRGPLGVECTCGRRGVVSAKTLGLYPGNIREIRAPALHLPGMRLAEVDGLDIHPRRRTRWIGQGGRRG